MSSNLNQYPVTSGEHRSFGASLVHLPVQYAKSIFTPTPRTFAREAEYANWGTVWLQLLILILVPSLLGLFRGLFRDSSTGIALNSNIVFYILSTITVGTSIASFILKLIFVPVIFFIGVTAQYLVAKAFRGVGSYLAQGYTTLLYQVPLEIIGGIVITVLVYRHFSTFLYTPLISIVLFVYGVIVNIAAIRGVHNLSAGRATAAVLIPYGVGILLACGLTFALAHYILNLLHSINR